MIGSVKPFQELYILTDAQCVLTSCMSEKFRHSSTTCNIIYTRVRCLMQQLFERGVVVHFHWVPGHAGIEGNERADHVCSVVSKALRGISRTAAGQRVWEIEGDLANMFAMFKNTKKTNRQQRAHFENKQRRAIDRWSRRPALQQKQRRELQEKRRETRKRARHIGSEVPAGATTLLESREETPAREDQHREAWVREERARRLDKQLRRSARIAASLMAKNAGNTRASAIEILD